MTDSNLNPKLAALRGLEQSLLSHRRAQGAKAPAVPPARSNASRRAAPAAPGDCVLPRSRRLPRILRSRRLRHVLVAFAALLVIVGVALGVLWYRLSSGPIALDFATDWLAAAIKENLGSRYNVQVGGTVLERDENGRTALRIRDIVVRDSDGAVVANAPRAEVGPASLSILSGHPRAASLNLVGAALSLRVEANGEVKVFPSGDKRPLVRATMLASADSGPLVATRSIANLATQAAPSAATVQAIPSTSSARGTFDNLGALLAWLDSINALGLDGHDLGEIGLKSGSLTVDDQRNGQKSTFDKINLSLTRQAAGEVTLRISSDNPDHPWVVLAGVKPLGEGRRAVSIEARKVMVRDLLLALRVDDGGMEPDMPMSLSLRAELARDGAPQTASGKLWLGPGTITDRKDPSSQLAIDQAEVGLDWDAGRHSLSAPFQIVSGGNRFTLVAHAEAPAQEGAPWRLGLPGGSIVLAPPVGDDTPLQLNRIAVLCRFDPVKRRLDIEHANIAGQNVAVALSGYIDFSTGDPRIAIGAAGRNMSMATFKQVWPAFVNAPVHVWADKRDVGGTVDRVEIATDAPLSSLQNGGPPVPDDGLSMEIAISGSAVQPIDDLPP